MDAKELNRIFDPVISIDGRLENAGDILADGAETFKKRHAVYGNNFLKVGLMCEALFPNGVTLNTAEEFIRFELLMMKIVKLSRYCESFTAGGHPDSVHDDMVYSAMLEFVDKSFIAGMVAERPKTK